MVNWNKLISDDKNSVVKFATHSMSAKDFQTNFSGHPNPARCAVRDNGTLYARRLARKALRRRSIKV